MDLALSTILIFLIIIPGFVSRFCYFTYPFSNQARSSDFLTEVFWSIIPGIAIHFLYILIVERFTSYIIVFDDVLFLISGSDDNARLDTIANNVHLNIGEIFLYYFVLLSISAILGFCIKTIVFKVGLDTKFDFFRYANQWYYILTGRILDIDDIPDDHKDIDLIGVDALCSVGGKNIIYIGELVRFYLSKDGGLESILLRYPIRRYLEDDGQSNKYYDIPSNYLHIPYKDILNLNIKYISIIEESIEND